MASKSVIEMMKFNDGIATNALGAGSAVQEALKSMKDIEAATMPSGMRLMRDMQRGLEGITRASDTHGLSASESLAKQALGVPDFMRKSDLAAFGRATDLHRSLANAVSFHRDQDRWEELRRRVTGSSLHESWNQMTKMADAMGLGIAPSRYLARISDFDRALRPALPESSVCQWSSHLRSMALPSMSILAHDWPKPVGLLAELPEPKFGASVSWLMRHRDEALVMTAALTEHSGTEDGLEVIVEGDPICAICGGPLTSLGSTTRWVGPKRGSRHRRIFPVCSKCFILEREQPGALVRALEELSRPALAIVHGGRGGDGIPRGVLRLVRVEFEEDTDD